MVVVFDSNKIFRKNHLGKFLKALEKSFPKWGRNNGIIGPETHLIKKNQLLVHGRLFFLGTEIVKRSQNLEKR